MNATICIIVSIVPMRKLLLAVKLRRGKRDCAGKLGRLHRSVGHDNAALMCSLESADPGRFRFAAR